MTIGSALNAQIGIIKETTPGTPLAVTTFNRIISESLRPRETTVVDQGLTGNLDIGVSRRYIAGLDAGGDVNMNVSSNGMGRWFQMCLGSTPTATQISTTGTYTQFHNLGSSDGVKFTIQKGMPETGGTVDPETLAGCAVTGWELSGQAGGLLMLKATIDAMGYAAGGSGANAIQTRSLVTTDQNFSFNLCSWSSFAAMTVVSNLWTPTTPAAVKVRNFSIKGAMPKKTDRWIAGSSTKDEQLVNGFAAITGTIDIDYSSTTYKTAYLAGTSLGLQMSGVGSVIGTSGTNHATVQCTLPAVTFEDGSTPVANGPDVITVSYPWTAYNDGTNGSIQIYLVSTDSAV